MEPVSTTVLVIHWSDRGDETRRASLGVGHLRRVSNQCENVILSDLSGLYAY